METSTKQEILNTLDEAKRLANDAFDKLDPEDQDKCSCLACLTCDVDEAIAEIENL